MTCAMPIRVPSQEAKESKAQGTPTAPSANRSKAAHGAAAQRVVVKRKVPEDSPAGQSAFAAEERLQAHLAKKLKVKKVGSQQPCNRGDVSLTLVRSVCTCGCTQRCDPRCGVQGKTTTGPEDGLDDLLTGLDDIMGMPTPGNGSASGDEGGSSADATNDGDSDGSHSGPTASSDNTAESLENDSAEAGSSEHDDGDEVTHEEPLRRAAAEHSDASGSNDSNASDSRSGSETPPQSPRGPASRTDPRGGACEQGKPSALGAETAKYVPPALRERRASSAQAECSGSAGAHDSGEHARELAVVRRQVRSLLNRVASANLAPIAQQIAAIFSSVPRHAVIDAIAASTMQVRTRCCACFWPYTAPACSIATQCVRTRAGTGVRCRLLPKDPVRWTSLPRSRRRSSRSWRRSSRRKIC